METSLSRQLRQLRAPQTGLLALAKEKLSLLFDPNEAANLDRDAFFEIGLSGLGELEKLDPRFSEFHNSLFSLSSKKFERAVHTTEVNKQIDKEIEKFLVLVSPYFTLRCSHKALEWLVNRYHVHEFNVEAWIMCVLPFHDTKIFVRAIQLLDLRSPISQWFWLKPLQMPGLPLPKNTLWKACAKDPGILKLICVHLQKSLEIHSEKQSVMNVYLAFFTTTIIGVLEHSTGGTEEQLTVIMPCLLSGLTCKCPDLIAGCYMIIAQLNRKAHISSRLAEDLSVSIIKGMVPTLTLEAITLLVTVCSKQNVQQFSIPQNNKTSALLASKSEILPIIAALASCYQISPFVTSVLRGFFQELAKEDNESRYNEIVQFFTEMIEEVRFFGNDSTAVIKSFVTGYCDKLQNEKISSETDDKYHRMKEVINRLEKQYPVDYERALHQIMADDGTSDERKGQIRKLLGRGTDADDTSLFLKLNHSSYDIRVNAIRTVVQSIIKGEVRNMSFAISSVVERLTDSNPLVVSEVLKLKEDLFSKLIPKEEQFSLLLAALTNCFKVSNNEWRQVRVQLISRLCSKEFISCCSESEIVELFLALLPFLFPLDRSGVGVTHAILNSDFSALSEMFHLIKSRINSESDKNAGKEEKSKVVVHCCKTVYEVIRQAKPFSTDTLNMKFFERALDLIANKSTQPFNSIPIIFAVSGLITKLDSISAKKLATRFIDALSPIIKTAKASKLNSEKLDVISVLSEARDSGFFSLEALLFSAMDVFESLAIDPIKMKEWNWATLSDPDNLKDASLLFLLSLYRFLIFGLTSYSAAPFERSLRTFFGRMKETKTIVFFLSLIWNDPDTHDLVKIVALKMSSTYLQKTADDNSWAIQLDSFVVPQLVCCLTSSNSSVRGHVLSVFRDLPCSKSMKTYGLLISDICHAAEELKLDQDQLKIVMSRYFSKKTTTQQSSALFSLVVSKDVPSCVKRGLLLALEEVNSVDILSSLLPVIDEMIEKTQDMLGIMESSIFTMLLERFTPQTAPILAKNEGWKCFQKALFSSKSIISTDEKIVLSPQDVVIEVITKDFLKAIPSLDVKLKIFDALLETITNTDKTVTGRQTRRALKRISFDAALVVTQLEFKPQAVGPTTIKVSELRGRRSRQPTIKPGQCLLWNRILAVLEMLQAKKHILNVHLLIAPLFDLLKNCIDEEEQSPLEYSKQLILSCLLECCQRLPEGESTKLASKFNTGLIVQCIRVSNNPQTHHQALLLLSLAAQLFPSHVLHNIMAIFTFMGTSVLRQDDAYSFQVIAKTLESVIPTLIEASKKTAVEPVVTTVIHVFADALPEVPEHRRIPVFDKLLTTLNPEIYLWLAPTLILSNMATQGPRLGRGLVKENDKDRVTPDVEFSLNVCHLYKPQVQLNACIRMLEYLQTLPAEKEEQRRSTTAASKDMSEGSAPFSLEVHSTRQLCHFKLLLVNFVSTLLSSNRLIEQLVELDEAEKPSLEAVYKKLVETALEYTQAVSRLVDMPVSSLENTPGPKFWRSLLHRCYDIIDRINSLLPRTMFISVVHSLLTHSIPSIRRRAMELLSAKLQHQSNFFAIVKDEKQLLKLIPSLTNIANVQAANEEAALNQQTAFFTLKLLCRFMGMSANTAFRPVLDVVVNTISPTTTSSTNVLASAFLCLAELIQNLGVQSLPYLPRYGANLVARLEDISNIENHDLLLLSVVTAVYKVVETLPQFLVPYLPPILKQICYLSSKHPLSEKPSQLQSRLQNIRHSLATSSVPRSLVSSVTQVYNELTKIESGKFVPSAAVEPLMSILSEGFAAMSSEELSVQLPALTSFFVKALDTRSLLSAQEATIAQMNEAEEPVVSALVSLVLKLSEANFRPLFFQLYEWATRATNTRKERLVTFYNVTNQIAEKLKSLFVVFAGHFIRNAAQVIVDTNYTQKGSLPFTGPNAEGNTIMLLEYVLRCLYRVCLHDNENFINKERFDTLMEPLVEQLENQLGDEQAVQRRVKEILIPLLAQMAVAASDDYLWKSLHYQLLLKMRSNAPSVRLGALSALSALVEKLGEDYLALLPEAIPFLAELLEDDVHDVEVAAQSTISNMETILGEPLQKYF